MSTLLVLSVLASPPSMFPLFVDMMNYVDITVDVGRKQGRISFLSTYG